MYFLKAPKEKHYFDLMEDRVMKEVTKQKLMEVIQLLSDLSYTFSDSIDQAIEGISKNYSLEKKIM